MEGIELTKVKHTYSGETSQKTPLNIDFGITNERQDCQLDTVCMVDTFGKRRVNGGDEGEGIWLRASYTHTK
jgi:hypothetical protein